MYKSETSKFRELFLDYCIDKGVDLGFGGDPVTPQAITVDLEKPYAVTGNSKQHLAGDATNLHWFNDNELDYIYSSHLLEDFTDTEEVLREWIRVIKPKGFLILLLPNEQRFRKYCEESGMHYNKEHKHADFSLKKVKSILESLNMKVIKEYEKLIYKPEKSDYNFAVIAQK